MRAGSHARLFDRSGSDYYVQSPLDKSQGWVSDVQVSGIVMKNPKTAAERNSKYRERLKRHGRRSIGLLFLITPNVEKP